MVDLKLLEKENDELRDKIKSHRSTIRALEDDLAKARWNLKEAEQVMRANSLFIQRFVCNLYAVMIDPINSPTGNFNEVCELLIEEARKQRDQINGTVEGT